MHEDSEGSERGVGVVQGIGPKPEKSLLAYWEDALKAAANSLGPDDEPGEFTVSTEVYVKANSPGFIDGFKVSLTP